MPQSFQCCHVQRQLWGTVVKTLSKLPLSCTRVPGLNSAAVSIPASCKHSPGGSRQWSRTPIWDRLWVLHSRASLGPHRHLKSDISPLSLCLSARKKELALKKNYSIYLNFLKVTKKLFFFSCHPKVHTVKGTSARSLSLTRKLTCPPKSSLSTTSTSSSMILVSSKPPSSHPGWCTWPLQRLPSPTPPTPF